VVDVVAETTRVGLMNEILYAHDLVLMAKIMEDLSEKFQNGKLCWRARGQRSTLGR